ncbi:hypothetical protein E0Z10_g8511 [Xylaria hypoxylon]|uniref:Uncharacterized protein n=1 Tax=Xylaria hypoxylon TaxID=37992 RepID=A0A4Z0YRS4_9PEZI|nr:hypothetical protein E0Z10_g8511 [Xylaria hypoxylon]
MAPLSSEPDAIRVVLKMARRKVLYGLISEIIAYMRSQLQLKQAEGRPGADETSPPRYSATDVLRTDISNPHGEGSREDGTRRPVSSLHSPALVHLRKAALLHFDSWRTETMGKLKEVLAKADDQKVIDMRRKRTEELSVKAKSKPAGDSEDLLSFGVSGATSTPTFTPTSQSYGHSNKANKELEAFQSHYHPIPTRLTTIPLRDREEALSAILLLLLSGGNYSAYSRTLICYLASALEIVPTTLDAEETAIATTMVSTAQKASAEAMSADTEAQKRRDEGRAGRLWKVGLASVAGAAIVGVTGGLAAPVVAAAVGGLMSSVGLGGLAGFLGIFWMNGALVGALFGAFGAKMTGEIVDRYAKEVEDFKFLPLNAEWGSRWKQQTAQGGNRGRDAEVEAEAMARRLRVTIGINGWLESEDDVTKPWRVLGSETEVFALRYEMSSLMSLGAQLRALVGSAAWNIVRAEILKRTVLVTLQSALWPVFLLSSASNIDNPFSFARNRSEKAGQILADALINRVQGERPVTLIGYSLGARVIYTCLRALAERKAFGLVDTVVLIGAPVPSNAAHWGMMRSVVAGKLYNVHSENDYILGFLYRSTSLQLGIAGLQAVGADIEGVEDLDLSEEVHGHLRYPGLIAQILHRCGFSDVKGGNSVIEKEEQGGIQLRDKDYAELGNLIDIDDDEEDNNKGSRPLLPPRRTARELANEKFDPMVKNVLEQKSDAQTLDMKLMISSPTLNSATSGTMASSRSAPDLLERSDLGGRATTEKRSATISHLETRDRPIPSQDAHRRDGEDEDDDEYGHGPITMLDNDELSDAELTMVEPLSIDDGPRK